VDNEGAIGVWRDSGQWLPLEGNQTVVLECVHPSLSTRVGNVPLKDLVKFLGLDFGKMLPSIFVSPNEDRNDPATRGFSSKVPPDAILASEKLQGFGDPPGSQAWLATDGEDPALCQVGARASDGEVAVFDKAGIAEPSNSSETSSTLVNELIAPKDKNALVRHGIEVLLGFKLHCVLRATF